MEDEEIFERWLLATTRIMEIRAEQRPGSVSRLADNYADYFVKMSAFILMIGDTWEAISQGGLDKSTLPQLAEHNRMLYEDVLPEKYENSYANPAYAVKMLGENYGQLMSSVYMEFRSCIGFAFEQDLEEIVIRTELFLEIYCSFLGAAQEEAVPEYDELRDIFYSFCSDYSEIDTEKRIKALVDPADCFAAKLIGDIKDFSDVRYLYRYGCYVSDNELETARFLAKLPEEKVKLMADTFTEGYRIGFEMTGKDLSIKSAAEIRYPLGFERMIKLAIGNFEQIGLKPAIHRPGESILFARSLYKSGFVGGAANRQCDFDHKDDKALILDKNYVNRSLEAFENAFKKYKAEAKQYAGPAVVESFGEKDFDPVNKKEALHFTAEQNKLSVENQTKAGEIQRRYIIEEERSFTIIAFPVPEITADLPETSPLFEGGADKNEAYGKLFDEIIAVNTLDYKLYQGIQQKLIDALDKAEHVIVKGCGSNETDMKVQLYPITDAEHQTHFENCVADVNIPVGEVFTSPVLKGTQGNLHVSHVFLNGLEFRNLKLTFEDGYIKSADCGNYENPEENKSYISENILFRHPTLPIGEFAIGTNTTAYAMGRKYGIEGKLPILIAEKTGPHFAVGDTCYSHAEDIKVYNPDGKEIISRTNETAELRHTDPAKAYFNCHTDITIPFDELGEITAVTADGERIRIISDGRFVLPGTEKLNEAL